MWDECKDNLINDNLNEQMTEEVFFNYLVCGFANLLLLLDSVVINN